jgi:hypothetical protein
MILRNLAPRIIRIQDNLSDCTFHGTHIQFTVRSKLNSINLTKVHPLAGSKFDWCCRKVFEMLALLLRPKGVSTDTCTCTLIGINGDTMVIVVEFHMDMALKVSDTTKTNCAIILLAGVGKARSGVMLTMSPPVIHPQVGMGWWDNDSWRV